MGDYTTRSEGKIQVCAVTVGFFDTIRGFFAFEMSWEAAAAASPPAYSTIRSLGSPAPITVELAIAWKAASMSATEFAV